MVNIKRVGRLKRKKRIRKKIIGTADMPRFCVFRSSKHIYAQVVDDSCGSTLAAASTIEKAINEDPGFNVKENDGKIIKAAFVGRIVGKRALEKGIKKVVFDRNGFLYHGRIKAVANGAREVGLKF
mmetsp:Transcript_475/g.305  ORF Transcript_475/g.305 Transcript_475/m.305 type:complete len:126 (-) Transcript_475:157-534(-)